MQQSTELKGTELKSTELKSQTTGNESLEHGLLHGGDIVSAAQKFQWPVTNWIDLSTGLNPRAYPSGDVPASAFQQLPYLQPSFLVAAQQYYGSDQFIPLIGSQMLIQKLPYCVAKYPVILPDVGYAEHQHSWQEAGFELQFYNALSDDCAQQKIERLLSENKQQHLVVINPNNPSGQCFTPQLLLKWADCLGDDCYLIVDEAFIDLAESQSVLTLDWPPNMLILRSFGKFFGLAGIRIGFAFCQAPLRQRIEEQLGLWMINGPAQYLATQAMLDKQWQRQARLGICQAAVQTRQLFQPLRQALSALKCWGDDYQRLQLSGRADLAHEGVSNENKVKGTVVKENAVQESIAEVMTKAAEVAIASIVKTQDERSASIDHTIHALFSSYCLPRTVAQSIYTYFAQQGILLRVIILSDQYALLRIGLLNPDNKEHQKRVEIAVEQCKVLLEERFQTSAIAE